MENTWQKLTGYTQICYKLLPVPIETVYQIIWPPFTANKQKSILVNNHITEDCKEPFLVLRKSGQSPIFPLYKSKIDMITHLKAINIHFFMLQNVPPFVHRGNLFGDVAVWRARGWTAHSCRAGKHPTAWCWPSTELWDRVSESNCHWASQALLPNPQIMLNNEWIMNLLKWYELEPQEQLYIQLTKIWPFFFLA